MTYEHDRALMEGHRNAAAEAYFDARPTYLNHASRDVRRAYEAAYAKAWDDCTAAALVQPAARGDSRRSANVASTNEPRHETPEPEEHNVRFRGHDIAVTKDALSVNWYIRVIHPNGSKLYDGWWRDSAASTWQEAIEEAKRGAMLVRTTR